MSRSLSAGMQTVSTDAVVRPFILIDADFDSAPVYMWSGIGDLSWDSKTWVGVGNLLTVDAIEESTDMKAVGTKISLSGIPSELISLALQEDYSGRTLSIYLGAFDESGAVITNPVVIFRGRMDVMQILEGGDVATIDLTAENRMIDFERTRTRRYTDQDQKIEYPNDKGFEFVSSIQDKEIVWGRV